MNENFIGKWVLLPEYSKYEHGMPPKKATYTFEKGKDISLNVMIEWIDSEDKELKIGFNIIPDGQRRKFENPQIADEVMSEFETENQLNSYTYKAGKTIAFALRIIDKNDKMEVIQRFFNTDGNSFDNVQYYAKDKANT